MRTIAAPMLRALAERRHEAITALLAATGIAVPLDGCSR